MIMPRGEFRRVFGQGRTPSKRPWTNVLTCLLVDFGDLPRFQSWSNLSSFPFETMLSEIRRAKQPDRDPIAIGIRFFICFLWGFFFWKFWISILGSTTEWAFIIHSHGNGTLRDRPQAASLSESPALPLFIRSHSARVINFIKVKENNVRMT